MIGPSVGGNMDVNNRVIELSVRITTTHKEMLKEIAKNVYRLNGNLTHAIRLMIEDTYREYVDSLVEERKVDDGVMEGVERVEQIELPFVGNESGSGSESD